MQRVLILDFGSQYTQLIARRIRQLKVYSEIHPYNMPLEDIKAFAPSALILSGGPSSVKDEGAPTIDPAVLELDLPILGICYGLQLMCHLMGGEVVPSDKREYGRAHVSQDKEAIAQSKAGTDLLKAFVADEGFEVWMSHGDKVKALPQDFMALATTPSTPYAIVGHKSRPLLGLQFHPEVSHTPRGIELLEAFLFGIAKLSPEWTMEAFLQEQKKAIQEKVGSSDKVICALSGGVDSSVVAALLAKAIPEQLVCIFVDNGVLRQGEVERVRSVFEHIFHVPLIVVDAAERFLKALDGVSDPERKRKIIGHEFIDVFEEEANKLEGVRYLAQGTLYPDVIESVAAKGPSATIKSHHNVGGLPERMNFELIEPLRELFKDEVRLLGEELGLPHHVCYRQPFPGPGLAIRIAGAVTKEGLDVLRQGEAIIDEEIRAAGYYDRLWQSFAVLLPVRSVGVMGDARTYDQTLCVRCVESVDGMTADWARLPHEVLGRISNRVINEVQGINRVVYDISSKPPATIEWE